MSRRRVVVLFLGLVGGAAAKGLACGDKFLVPGRGTRFRAKIDQSRERIVGGARLGEAFEEAELMPPVALSMVKVGEEAGRLPVTFERLSRLYDREVKEAVKKALGLLEPLVTVVLGLVVGGVAVLVVGTIYSAMKGIGK